ncbi:MAG TPA: GNAT family N-acetyltransferase [Anaerolineaceae bacterium]|nr:GNAT family N-acetyltransferase [Anaerolineaceae bacterium]HPA33499.1 GNAT family N-acetyltransferase [Anaerolineaceae bacterium]HQL38181.1 GNAT family N-acetyltransferase [Anaerolineaceae bacterium]HQO97687.1 GNAT family N-acetyltransferase [Anaerolineaceae bacterium]HQP61299.1 GNAT family N-acetyltransferase [Anaerolineaceae bacterium]
MSFKSIQLKPLTGLQDELLIPWLELYELAFPANERILVADILSLLKNSAALQHEHLAGAVSAENEFLGLIWYSERPNRGVALLWYLAVLPSLRSRGVGAQMYRAMVQSLDPEQYTAVVYEVEKPAEAHSPEQAEFSRRRIEFYRRNGALLLGGVHYLQEVGSHVPPTPMHLMVHPLHPITPEQAFAICQPVFGQSLHQAGKLTLD